jgi:hypothetical protein
VFVPPFLIPWGRGSLLSAVWLSIHTLTSCIYRYE